MSYTLSILGQPALTGPDGPIRYSATKALALVWYLAAQPENAFSRSHLTTLLWPDDSESDGRNRLNTTLSRLRQALPVFPVRQNGDMLQWDRTAPVALDTLRFLDLTRPLGLDNGGSQNPAAPGQRQPLTEAVALWRGPLLHGFSPSFSSTYEEWLEAERNHWERRILEALARLVQVGEGLCAWDRVINHAQQALSIDPLQERFHRWLMIAYYQSGERAAALNQYTLCAQVTEQQLGTSPDPITLALRDQIVRGDLERLPLRSTSLPAPPVEMTAAAEQAGLTPSDVQVLASWSGRSVKEIQQETGFQSMSRFALTDPLTGLYNRHYIDTLMHMEISAGHSPLLVLLDMQGLRRINDHLGYERGDAVLQACAAYFQEELPGSVVARVGGGGFAALFLNKPAEEVLSLVQQVISSLPQALVIPDLHGAIQFAAGVAAYPTDGTDPQSLYRAAAGAVYLAKRQRIRRVQLAREVSDVSPLSDPRTPELSAALAGREQLWERLQSLMAAAEAGHGCMVTLEGPIGAGKSRLLTDLADSARFNGWRVAQISPDMVDGPYLPISACLQQLTGKPPQFKDGVDAYPQVNAVVNQLLAAIAEGPPVLICIDKLHEASNLTALALVQLGWYIGKSRALLVMGIQSGANEVFDWTSLQIVGMATDRLVREQLAGLDLNSTRRLAIGLLGSVISAPTVRLLHETTGGNPLHITQVIKAWNESGVLSPGPQGWTADFASASSAPRDLFQALVWRVRQLEPAVQETLGLAAVLGRQFRPRELRMLSGNNMEELILLLSRAVEEQFISPVGPDLMRFTHPIIQEAAYSNLSPVTRRVAHGLAGMLLVEAGTASAAELARHFDAVGSPERSFAYHVAAGEEAAARFGYAAARYHLSRAWHSLPEAGVDTEVWRSRLALQLCRVAQAAGDLRTAAETCQEALQLFPDMPPDETLAILLQFSEVVLASGDEKGLKTALARAEGLPVDGSDPLDQLRIRALKARARLMTQADEASLIEVLQLAQEAETLGAYTLEGLLYSEAARVMTQLGQPRPNVAEMGARAVMRLPVGSGPAAPLVRLTAALLVHSTDEALHYMEQALEAAVLSGEVALWPQILHMIGRLERASGSWANARRCFEASLLVATRNGRVPQRCETMGELGLLLAWMGEEAESIALVSTALDVALGQGLTHVAANARVRLARCLVILRQPKEALRLLAAAESDWKSPSLEHRLVRLDAWIQSGDLTRALAEGAVLPRPHGEWQVYHALLLGQLAQRQGRPAEALRWLNQALAQAERPFIEQYEIAHAYAEQAYALRSLGDTDTAEQRLTTARTLLERIGLHDSFI